MNKIFEELFLITFNYINFNIIKSERYSENVSEITIHENTKHSCDLSLIVYEHVLK